MAKRTAINTILSTLTLAVVFVGFGGTASAAESTVKMGVFPPLNRDDALRGPAYGANSVSSSEEWARIKAAAEGILVSSSKGNPTEDERAAYHNIALTLNDYSRLGGTVPYEQQLTVREWMKAKGYVPGKPETGAPIVNEAVSAAQEIYDRACTGESLANARCIQSKAFLDWVDIVGSDAPETQMDLVVGSVTSHPEPFWAIYFPDPNPDKSFFSYMLEAKKAGLPSPDGREFGPTKLEDTKGEFACVAREDETDTRITCGKVEKRGKNKVQIGNAVVTQQDLDSKKALLMEADDKDKGLLGRTEGFVTGFIRGGAVFGGNQDTGSLLNYGLKAGGRIGSLEVAAILSMHHLPTGGARDSSGPRSFGYRTAFAPGISLGWAPWFTERFGLFTGVDLMALLSADAIGMSGFGLVDLRWRFGAKQRGMVGVGLFFGRSAMMKDLGVPRVKYDLQENAPSATRNQNQWAAGGTFNIGGSF